MGVGVGVTVGVKVSVGEGVSVGGFVGAVVDVAELVGTAIGPQAVREIRMKQSARIRLMFIFTSAAGFLPGRIVLIL